MSEIMAEVVRNELRVELGNPGWPTSLDLIVVPQPPPSVPPPSAKQPLVKPKAP